MYTSEGPVCQLPLELVAGIYRVVVWDPARGYGDQMPLLTVMASITAISPDTSESPNSQLGNQKRVAEWHICRCLVRIRLGPVCT